MTWSDPIVEEIRRARDAYAARFNYDLRAIFRDLQEQEKRSDRRVVSYVKDLVRAAPNSAPLATESAPTASDDSPSVKTGPVAEL